MLSFFQNYLNPARGRISAANIQLDTEILQMLSQHQVDADNLSYILVSLQKFNQLNLHSKQILLSQTTALDTKSCIQILLHI